MKTAPAGNCAFAADPLTHGSTPVPLWLAAFAESPLPTLDLAECRRLIVVSPHTDDETLGLGAMATQLTALGLTFRWSRSATAALPSPMCRSRTDFVWQPSADTN